MVIVAKLQREREDLSGKSNYKNTVFRHKKRIINTRIFISFKTASRKLPYPFNPDLRMEGAITSLSFHFREEG